MAAIFARVTFDCKILAVVTAFDEMFAARTASEANLFVVTFDCKILAVVTAFDEMFAARTADEANLFVVTFDCKIFAVVTALSAICAAATVPPNVSKEISFKFVPSE